MQKDISNPIAQNAVTAYLQKLGIPPALQRSLHKAISECYANTLTKTAGQKYVLKIRLGQVTGGRIAKQTKLKLRKKPDAISEFPGAIVADKVCEYHKLPLKDYESLYQEYLRLVAYYEESLYKLRIIKKIEKAFDTPKAKPKAKAPVPAKEPSQSSPVDSGKNRNNPPKDKLQDTTPASTAVRAQTNGTETQKTTTTEKDSCKPQTVADGAKTPLTTKVKSENEINTPAPAQDMDKGAGVTRSEPVNPAKAESVGSSAQKVESLSTPTPNPPATKESSHPQRRTLVYHLTSASKTNRV